MQDEYQDALARLRQASLWQEFHGLRDQQISNRPSYFKERLLAIARAPIEQDARLGEAAWAMQSNILIAMSNVLLQATADSLLHPNLSLTFPSWEERARTELDAKMTQARMIDEVLEELPEKGKHVSIGPVTCVYSEVRMHLLQKLAELWVYGPEDGADEIFAMLIERMRGEHSKITIDALKKTDALAGIERTRRAVLKLLGPDTRINQSAGNYARTLAVNWLGKLTEHQVVLIMLIEQTLARDFSPEVENALLSHTQALARLDRAARLFMDKTRLTVGENWKIISIDPVQMTVHLKHGAQEALHGVRNWEEMEISWKRELGRFALPDADADIKFVIEIYDLARPGYKTHHFNYTIQGRPAHYHMM